MRLTVTRPVLAKNIGQFGASSFLSCRQLRAGRQHRDAPAIAGSPANRAGPRDSRWNRAWAGGSANSAGYSEVSYDPTASERVDAFALLNAAFLLSAVIDLLVGADVQGLISAFTEEDPQHRLIGLLVFLYLAQQALGKNRVTVFFAFALFHPNHHAFRIDIAEFKMDQLSDSKSRRVRCHQQTAIAQFNSRCQQLLDLSRA